MKRGKPMRRGAPLERGDSRMKRTPLKRWGARKKREGPEEAAFWRAVLKRCRVLQVVVMDGTRVRRVWVHRCERCRMTERVDAHGRYVGWRVRAHHIVMRSRAPGWADLHNPEKNGAGLCEPCHDAVHAHTATDFKRWLRPSP